MGDEDTRGQGVRAGPGDVVRGGKAAGVARPAQPRAGSRHTGTWPGAEIWPLSAQQDGPRGCGDQRAGSVSGHPVGQPLVRSPRRPPWMPWTARNGDAGGTDGNEPHSPSLPSRGPRPPGAPLGTGRMQHHAAGAARGLARNLLPGMRAPRGGRGHRAGHAPPAAGIGQIQGAGPPQRQPCAWRRGPAGSLSSFSQRAREGEPSSVRH